jgi:hypothetical protein
MKLENRYGIVGGRKQSCFDWKSQNEVLLNARNYTCCALKCFLVKFWNYSIIVLSMGLEQIKCLNAVFSNQLVSKKGTLLFF